MENEIKFCDNNSDGNENKKFTTEKPKMKMWKKILIVIIISIFFLVGLLLYLPSILGIFFRDIPGVNDADLKIEQTIVPDSDNAYFDYIKLDSMLTNKIGDKDVATFLANNDWDQNFVDKILSKNQKRLKFSIS